MNASARGGQDDGPTNDGPSDYAPKNARLRERDRGPENMAPRVTPFPRDVLEEPQPPWRQRQALFVGNAAAANPPPQHALTPDWIREPQLPAGRASGGTARLTGLVVVVVAMCAAGYLWGVNRGTAPPPEQPAATLYRADAMPDDSAPSAGSEVVRSLATGAMAAATAPTRQFIVNAERLRKINEPAPLTISTANVGTSVDVVISGLVAGSTLSAGRPIGPDAWILPATEFANISLAPPPGFGGIMNLVFELRAADNTFVDRTRLQLEWSGGNAVAARKPQPRASGPAETASMMKYGAELMANRDVAAARLIFKRAAELGDAAAAFALAETYDPLVLRKLGGRGAGTSDIALAQSWYEKARDMGSTIAAERIVSLAQVRE